MQAVVSKNLSRFPNANNTLWTEVAFREILHCVFSL